MSKTFRVKLLPALHGDCIWIEYGENDAIRRVLIDGGPVGAYYALRQEIEKLPIEQRTFELLVVTHVDSDHIDGIVKLLRHPELGVKFQEVWFNGWPQLKDLRTLTPSTGQDADETRAPLSGSYLDHLMLRRGEACNARFFERAACVADSGALPFIRLEGGLELTLLSPTVEKLRELREAWYQAFRKWNTNPDDAKLVEQKLEAAARFRGDGDAVPALPAGVEGAAPVAEVLDKAVANGSSIAFVAEFAGKRCAFLGDAHAPLVEKSFRRMAESRGEPRLQLAAVKVSHHGSSGNTTRSLLKAIDCRTYLVSTDGSVFNHPDDEAIRRIVEHAKPVRLLFNYRSDRTMGWEDPPSAVNPDYSSRYPRSNGEALDFDVLASIDGP